MKSSNRKSGDTPSSSSKSTPRGLRSSALVITSKRASNYLHEEGMVRKRPKSIKELEEEFK